MKKILFLYIIHLGFALQPIQIQACCLDNEVVLANELCSGSKKALYSQIAKAAER